MTKEELQQELRKERLHFLKALKQGVSETDNRILQQLSEFAPDTKGHYRLLKSHKRLFDLELVLNNTIFVLETE